METLPIVWKLTEPNWAFPAAAMTMLPPVAELNVALPVILTDSRLESARVTVPASTTTFPVTEMLDPESVMEVSERSVRLPAVLAPCRTIAESSVTETAPVDVTCRLPKLMFSPVCEPMLMDEPVRCAAPATFNSAPTTPRIAPEEVRFRVLASAILPSMVIAPPAVRFNVPPLTELVASTTASDS